MVWEDECVPISFLRNISLALAVPLFALSYAFTTAVGKTDPARLPSRTKGLGGGSTSSEASATTKIIPPTRYVPCCAPLPIAVDAENGKGGVHSTKALLLEGRLPSGRRWRSPVGRRRSGNPLGAFPRKRWSSPGPRSAPFLTSNLK